VTTPEQLLQTVRAGEVDQVQQLLAAGVDPNDTRADEPLLSICLAKRRLRLARVLLEAGADPNSAVSGRTALHDVSSWSQYGDEVSLLLEHGAAVDATDMRGKTPLMAALEQGDDRNEVLLLEHRASVTASDASGRPVLDYACQTCSPLRVRRIVRAGARADLASLSENSVFWLSTSFRESIREGDFETAACFLALGLDVNTPNARTTPLLEASTDGDVAAVTWLLDHGASANFSPEKSEAPLIGAARYGQLPIVELLLAHGADRELVDRKGRRAVDHADERGHATVAARLRA
jgi:ankyrin repeat protein